MSYIVIVTSKAVDQVLRWYPRIYFACHTRHVRDPQSNQLLSQHQASILSHLDDVDPTTMSELATHLGVTISTMSLSVKRLERQGYIWRTRSTDDARVVHLRLSEAGVRVREAQSVLDRELVEAMLAQLSAADRKQALTGLRLLGEAAEEAIKTAGLERNASVV